MNIENSKKDKLNDQIIGYLTGELSDVDRKELFSIIAVDSESKKYFDDMVNTWQYAGTLTDSSESEIKGIWNKLKARIHDEHNEQSGQEELRITSISRNRFNRISSIAAALVIAFSAGGLFAIYLNLGKGNFLTSPQTYQVVTPNGTRSEILLSDGTQVWLNAGSTLRYKQDYNLNSREVELSGEAFFQVKKKLNKPFVVKSAGLQIKALGTSFNVKAYPDDQEISATLVEGIITIEGKVRDRHKFIYTLSPGQNIIFIRSDLKHANKKKENKEKEDQVGEFQKKASKVIETIEVKKNVNTILFTSWKDKRWIIEHQSFIDLAIMLERRYNVKIHYNASDYKDLRFSGIIENETLEQVLKILQLSAPIKYAFGKGEVTIEIDKLMKDRFELLNKH